MEQKDPNSLEYLLVLDFEATCEENVRLQPCSEIIEFPVRAIKLPENKQICKPFHYYIKPRFNPKLTKFCTSLTGITQEMVDGGVSLQECLIRFDQWIKDNNFQNFAFVTCGDWDLKTCLSSQLATKKIQMQDYFKRYINIKKIFPPPAGIKNPDKFRARGMTDMLDMLGLPLQGKHHSGIDDTYNIAVVAMQLIRRGVRFDKKVVSYLK